LQRRRAKRIGEKRTDKVLATEEGKEDRREGSR